MAEPTDPQEADDDTAKARDDWFAHYLGEQWEPVGGGIYRLVADAGAPDTVGDEAPSMAADAADELVEALDPAGLEKPKLGDEKLSRRGRRERRHGFWPRR
jgi:hypothetical protein